MKKIVLLFGVCLCLMLGQGARADEFHYNNIIIGERAGGMGGAYTALSNDTSGMFYNPAGMVYSAGNNLSASVNAFYNMTKEYKAAIGGNVLRRASSAIVPNFFGVQKPWGRFVVGFSYAVPDNTFEDLSETFTNFPVNGGDANLFVSKYMLNLNTEDRINLFGPSMAMKINDRFAVGLTLYIHKRDSLYIQNELIRLSNGSDRWNNFYAEVKEWGLKPVLGLQWRPSEKLSLGLSVAKTTVLRSDVQAQEIVNDSTVDPPVLTDQNVSSNDRRDYPYQINAGVAFQATPAWLLSMDVNYYTPLDYMFMSERVKRNPVVNVALGTEYALTPSWIFRGGLYTNMSNTDNVTVNSPMGDEKIDMFGGTVSLTYIIAKHTITLGGNYSHGSGTSRILVEPVLQDASATSWMLFISSSYTF